MSDAVQTEIKGLALSCVNAFNDAIRLRAAGWFNLIHKLGVHVPLFVAHDFGQLWTLRRSNSSAPIAPSERLLTRAAASDHLRALVTDYNQLINKLAVSEVVQRAQRWQLNDQVAAVLMTKVLNPVYRAWSADARRSLIRVQLPPDVERYNLERRETITPLAAPETAYLESYLETLLENELQVRHAVEQLDLDTLRLLGLFQGDMGTQSTLEMVDLLNLFSTPMVNDIVNFSLQIIPSVLEATKLRDAQTASLDGYEGVERLGNIDNIMLTEFAYDEEIFNQKYLDNELFYYSRSRAREEEKKLHYLFVDASASMRGRRSVFARGVALAMIKKLLLTHERPLLRFFDSQLYQLVEVAEGFSVPYLLSFRSERGRHYRKVFEQILHDVRRLRERKRQDVIVYILTHGQCHVPRDLIGRLREVAYLFGIFILPGDPIELDYIDMLHKSRFIGDEILNSSSSRKRAAMDILREI